jgi:hypothetical protein
MQPREVYVSTLTMSRKIRGWRDAVKDMKNRGKAEAGAEIFFEAGLLRRSDA